MKIRKRWYAKLTRGFRNLWEYHKTLDAYRYTKSSNPVVVKYFTTKFIEGRRCYVGHIDIIPKIQGKVELI